MPRPPEAGPADSTALGLGLDFWFCCDIKLMVSGGCTARALMTALLPMSGALSGEVVRRRPVAVVGEGILVVAAFVGDSDRNAACLSTEVLECEVMADVVCVFVYVV